MQRLWLSIPAHTRKGLLRLYVVVSVPWIGWYGYQIGSHGPNWYYLPQTVWKMLAVPIGGPIVALFGLWIVEGFSELSQPVKPQSDQPPNSTTGPKQTVQQEIELLRGRLIEDILRRPDLVIDRYLRTGVLLDKRLDPWPVLDQASLTKEQKSALPDAYYSPDGIKPELLAPVAGYPTAALMIDHLIKLQQEIHVSGGLEKLMEALVEAELVKRLRWKKSSPQ